MIDRNAEDTVLLLMALAALIVFMLMLIAASAAIRAERRPKSPRPGKDEPEPLAAAVETPAPLPQEEATTGIRPVRQSKFRSFAVGLPGLFSAERARSAIASAQNAIFDRLPVRLQTVNWLICLLIATYLAWSNYSRLGSNLKMTSLYSDFVFLAVFSPSCLGIVWLRLTGIPWRQALLLLICVPAAVGVVEAVLGILAIFSHLLGYS